MLKRQGQAIRKGIAGFLLIVFVVSTNLLQGSFAQNTTSYNSVEEVEAVLFPGWTLHKLRTKAFEDVKLKMDVLKLHPADDPHFSENKRALEQDRTMVSDREVTRIGKAGAYSVVYANGKTVDYSATGKTLKVALSSGERFPYKTLRYLYPSGKLDGVTLGFSPKDIFSFDAHGDLVSGNIDAPMWERPTFEKKVTQIGQKLLADNHVKEKITFFIARGKDLPNAQASESFNTVFVFKELIPYVESDDEMAAVLGHEIAHIILRHRPVYPRRDDREVWLRKQLRLPEDPPQDSLEFEKEQRKELDADRFGLRLMARSGYKPDAMLSLLRKLSSDGTNPWRTHPSGSQRIKAIETQIRRLARQASE